jgi:hypothetical protein
MSFPPLQRMKSRGFGSQAPYGARAKPYNLDAGIPHLPPSGLSVFHALAGFHPATPVRACFIPVTLLGFRLQGLVPPRGAAPLSRPPALLPFVPRARPVSYAHGSRLQSLDPPGESGSAKVRNSFAAVALLASSPLRLSRSPARRGTGVPQALLALTSPRPPHPPMHFTSRACARHGCASEYWPAGVLGISLSRGRRPSWGFSPLPDRILANPSGCR